MADDFVTGHQALYLYKARYRSAYDADTIRFDIDLGCSTWRHNESVRLAYVDAWEVRGPERDQGVKARAWVQRILQEQEEVYLHTMLDRSGKYGRLLAVVYLPYPGMDLSNLDYRMSLNHQLLLTGHAVPYDKKTYPVQPPPNPSAVTLGGGEEAASDGQKD